MIIDLNKKERDLLVYELEETTAPQIRELVASGMRKNSHDKLKRDEEILKKVPAPPLKGFILGKLVGFLHHDVTIIYDEIRRLMADLLYTDSPPCGKTKLTDWLKENSVNVGLRYSNESKRRNNGIKPCQMFDDWIKTS